MKTLQGVYEKRTTIIGAAEKIGFENIRVCSGIENETALVLLVSLGNDMKGTNAEYAHVLANYMSESLGCDVIIFVEGFMNQLNEEVMLERSCALEDKKKLETLFKKPMKEFFFKQSTQALDVELMSSCLKFEDVLSEFNKSQPSNKRKLNPSFFEEKKVKRSKAPQTSALSTKKESFVL